MVFPYPYDSSHELPRHYTCPVALVGLPVFLPSPPSLCRSSPSIFYCVLFPPRLSVHFSRTRQAINTSTYKLNVQHSHSHYPTLSLTNNHGALSGCLGGNIVALPFRLGDIHSVSVRHSSLVKSPSLPGRDLKAGGLGAVLRSSHSAVAL